MQSNPRLCSIILALLCLHSSMRAQGDGAVSLDGGAWKISPQAEVKEGGEQISTPGYAADGWVQAQVPGTVFVSYVLAGKEKDPNYGDNAYKVDLTKYDRNFWYRTDFTAADADRGGRWWLNLDGVNRDADVFLNGRKVGSMRGFFQRGRFDVTDALRATGTNSLAVLDYVPVQSPNRTHSENYSSPSFICTKGWDWMPRVPGFDMGIYKDVRLTHTGDVVLIDPWIRTLQAGASGAELSLRTDVQNTSGAAVSGQLVGEINPGKITFSQAVTIPPGATQTVKLTSETTPALHIANPKLWWPNGYGDPNLYTLRISFQTGATLSDQKDVTFGIRKYSYDTNNKTLHFYINGMKLFPKGGSWGMAEYLLRCKAQDYDRMVSFHREEHFNIIRNWMGMTPDEAFYEACDKYGIMVWDEFWLNSSGGAPADPALYQANAVEKIKQFRNHACVALWCADNEGTPPKPINDGLRDAVATYDGDDRYYQPNSHSGNLSGSGPWHDLDPTQYFIGVPGGGGGGQLFGMRSEMGTATFTNFESLKKFMPKDTWWPRNDMWNKHFFGPSAANGGPNDYYMDLGHRYGPAHGIEDFCRKAQLLNIETMKAIFEGWLDHSDTNAAGMIIWMSQSAYPSFVWQTFDYYYDLTGAYWGAKSACEPIHIYWNENDDWVRVVNTSGKDVDGLTAEAWIYNLDGTQKYQQKTQPFSSSASKVADCFTLSYPADLTKVHFIRLRLTDSAGATVSENFYWRGTTHLHFKDLAELKNVRLSVTSQTMTANGKQVVTANVTNPAGSGTVAFAIRPMLIKPSTGDQILPANISDGYFTLMPGETKQVSFAYDAALAGAETPQVRFDCYNNTILPEDRDMAENRSGNLASGEDVKVSSNDHFSNGADALVDGDEKTRWASAWLKDPQWAVIDLEQSADIGRVVLKWQTAYATSYQVQVSDDAKNWTNIYSTTAGKGGVENLTPLNGLAAGVRGRYLRLLMTQRAEPKFGYSLYEVEVYKR